MSLGSRWDFTVKLSRSGRNRLDYSGDFIGFREYADSADVTVKPFASTPDNPLCDGPSCPRFLRSRLSPAVFAASVPHDLMYVELERIAKANGVSVYRARKFADEVFASAAAGLGAPPAEVFACRAAVRLLGGVYHSFNRLRNFLAR